MPDSRHIKFRRISQNFLSRLKVLLPKKTICRWGDSPINGELYVYNSRYRASVRTEIRLTFKESHGGNTRLVSLKPFPVGLVKIRIACTRREFMKFCTNKQALLLKPDICIDTSTLGVEILSCDLEKAAQAAEVCAKLFESGILPSQKKLIHDIT